MAWQRYRYPPFEGVQSCRQTPRLLGVAPSDASQPPSSILHYLEDASMTGDISTDTVLLAFAAAIAVTIANLRVTHTACGELGADSEIIREHVDIPLVGLYSL